MIRTPDNEMDWLRISSEFYQHQEDTSPKQQILNDRELKIFNDVTTVDNPRNREIIIGSSKTILDYKPKKNNKKIKRKYCIILPNERMYWDFLCMVAIILVIFLLPFDIAFSLHSDFLTDFNYFTVALFTLDMLVNFNTAFIDKGEIIDDRKIIAKEYFKLWFWIDLISTFPVDMIVESQTQVDEGEQTQKSSQNVQLLRFVRFIRFMKVIKVIRVLKLRVLLTKFQEQFNFTKSLLTLIDLFVLITVLLYISHLFGCIWRFLALQEEQAGVLSWIEYYSIEDQGWFDVYIYSIYWAAITMTTVGYGDVVPVTNNEKMFGIVVMLLSCCIFAFVMNSIGTIFVNLDQNQKLIRFKMGNATKFLNRSDLKQELYGRVKLFLEFKYENEYDHINEVEALSILSEGLRDEVIGQVHIQKLLNAKMQTNYKQIIINLAMKLEEQTFGPEECIFQEGTMGQDLYFLNQGEVLIGIKNCTTYLATLGVGSTFGEVSFFTDTPRTASVYSLNFVQVSRINRSHFLDSFKGGLSKSKQQYFMDKHIVEFQGNFKSFQQTCFSCNSDSHYAIRCPQIHYVVDLKRKLKLIEKLRDEQQLFRDQFKRRKKVRYNARRWIKMTQTVAEEIVHVNGHIDYDQFDFKLYTLNQILDEYYLHMEEDDMDCVFVMDTFFPLYNSDKIAKEYNLDKYY